MLLQCAQVQSLGIVYRSLGVAHRDDGQPGLIEQAGRRASDLAEALDRNGGGLVIEVEVLEGLEGQVGRAAAGRVCAALGAADIDRLTGDRRGHRVARMHGDGVHDPGHHLRVGAHVGGGDVLLRADENGDLGRIAAREVLELVERELGGVASDCTFRASVRNADRGALPRHQHGERLDQLQIGLRVVADAALGRAAADVVLHAPTGEYMHRPVVHSHREVNGELALDFAQGSARVVRKANDVKTPLGGMVGGGAGFDRHARETHNTPRTPHQCKY